MRLSTRMRYGTRAMVDLASQYPRGPMSSAELARNQGLSPKYLEALLGRLRASGLVIATRGPSGGYQLARPPMDISVRDLYDVLEGGGYVACTDDATVCERGATCVTREPASPWGSAT